MRTWLNAVTEIRAVEGTFAFTDTKKCQKTTVHRLTNEHGQIMLRRLTIDLLVANFLQYVCVKNYENSSAVDKFLEKQENIANAKVTAWQP